VYGVALFTFAAISRPPSRILALSSLLFWNEHFLLLLSLSSRPSFLSRRTDVHHLTSGRHAPVHVCLYVRVHVCVRAHEQPRILAPMRRGIPVGGCNTPQHPPHTPVLALRHQSPCRIPTSPAASHISSFARLATNVHSHLTPTPEHVAPGLMVSGRVKLERAVLGAGDERLGICAQSHPGDRLAVGVLECQDRVPRLCGGGTRTELTGE